MKRQVKAKKTDHKLEQGITLLLVVVLLSAILSIGIGIFNLTIGQIRISGEISDSFIALYAADQGIERTLYRDRNIGPLCDVEDEDPCTAEEVQPSLLGGGCYEMFLRKSGSNTTIQVTGQYRCGANPVRVIKRGFSVSY